MTWAEGDRENEGRGRERWMVSLRDGQMEDEVMDVWRRGSR